MVYCITALFIMFHVRIENNFMDLLIDFLLDFLSDLLTKLSSVHTVQICMHTTQLVDLVCFGFLLYRDERFKDSCFFKTL